LNGDYRIGWLKESTAKLHGYGATSQPELEGLFEDGKFMRNPSKIMQFDHKLETLAQKLELSKYII